MLTEVAGRFVCAIVVVIFGYLGGSSFASAETKSLALSKALSQVKLFAGLTDAEKDALKA